MRRTCKSTLTRLLIGPELHSRLLWRRISLLWPKALWGIWAGPTTGSEPCQSRGNVKDAIAQAERVSHYSDQGTWLQSMGYIYLDANRLDAAEAAYQRAFTLAQHTNKDDLIDALIALAFVYERTNKLEKAKSYADEALAKAKENNNSREKLYAQLVQGRVATRLRDIKQLEFVQQSGTISREPRFSAMGSSTFAGGCLRRREWI